MAGWETLTIGAGTGWKEISVAAGTGWKELTFDSVSLDAGGACIDRPTTGGAGNTYLQIENPVNGDGTLTNVCIWCVNGSTGYEIGSFYLVSGNTYKCRSAYSIGALSAGQHSSISISLSVETDDLLGVYWLAGSIERTNAGSGYRWASGNKCVVDNESTYTLTANRGISCYATN